jgi:peptidoglycan hydrolase CwlO-like protein
MPVRKFFLLILSVVLAVGMLFYSPPAPTVADELDDINRELAKLTDDLNKSVAATKPLEGQLDSMKRQIESIKQQIVNVESGIVVKKKEIDDGYKRLSEKEKLIARTIREFYVTSYYDSPLLTFLSLDNAFDITQVLAYQRAKTRQDKIIITNIALSLVDLERKKADLEREQKTLAVAKVNLDEQSTKLDQIVKGAKDYQGELSGKIAALTAKQQEIIAAKSGGSAVSVGSGELADEYLSSLKGFNESAPSGYFAIFSFGGHSHRDGMSQYGARGRAQAGQSYKDILQKYYGKQPVDKDTGGSIKVGGHGEMDFEGRYLLGIAEMPSSWHIEALKAQAVAARTYAYRYKQQGTEICTTQSCQVFLASKADNPPAAWKQAVEETRGKVLEDVVTYYSSTSGGWLKTSGWDTTDGSGGNNFTDRAYEKLGGSPWLYKAWWRQGYSNSGATCGRSNPWLSPQEMADIYNAAKYRDERVTPITTACWGGNPYSMDELRQKAGGDGISSVSSINVLQGNGVTNTVIFQTDKGQRELTAAQFRDAVNVRAPGYIAIPQGSNFGTPFFNIEHK